MASLHSIPGIRSLWQKTLGDSRVCIAILDGPADLTHPCFVGADLRRVDGHRTDAKQSIPEAIEHATHITSVVLGQHGSSAEGIAPRCSGINVPVIYDPASMLDPIALTHAIDIAFREGANIIHVASCIPTKLGKADDLVARAVRTCIDNNVLVVAPAGNDEGECFCIPAAIPGVIAVGAVDDVGRAARFSNWGGIYQKQGVVAPGCDITGAAPGGETSTHKGTSCAAPIVTGTAALLMSLQLREGWPINARSVRNAILGSALPCETSDPQEQQRCLAGMLNVPGAIRRLFALSREQRPSLSQRRSSNTSGWKPRPSAKHMPFRSVIPTNRDGSVRVAEARASALALPAPRPAVTPLAYDGTEGNCLVFFIGLVGYDFGTEARRDTFKQQMPPALYNYETGALLSEAGRSAENIRTLLGPGPAGGFHRVPPDPFDTRQMVAYLRERPDEARSLIWTLNLELTPVYSIERVGPFGDRVYHRLVGMLDGQSQAEGSPAYVERVSVPAVLSGQSVRLFSGQVVSQLLVDATRGMHEWNTSALIEAALAAVARARAAPPSAHVVPPPDDDDVREILRQVLNKLYYEYRNLGIASPDRALNFAATNIFQVTDVLVAAITNPKGSKTLDRIDVVKSPYGRIDSDCWDVLLKFFDPEKQNRGYTVVRFTLDVSDKLPVTMGSLVTYASTI